MLAGAEGTGLIVIARELALDVPQALFAVTVMLPEEAPKETVIDVVPCPAVIVAPEGTVHV